MEVKILNYYNPRDDSEVWFLEGNTASHPIKNVASNRCVVQWTRQAQVSFKPGRPIKSLGVAPLPTSVTKSCLSYSN